MIKKLLNTEKIISETIENTPWQYKIIDNILEESFFLKLKNSVEKLSQIQKDEDFYSDGIWPNEFESFNINKELYDSVVQCQSEFLSIKNELFSQFDFYLRSELGYFGIPKINYSMNNLDSAIHDEGKTKSLALIIYLTRLYEQQSSDSLIKEVDWKPNRGFLMCSQPGVTWHSYKNNGSPRYTLNLYCEKMEGLESVRSNSTVDRYAWFLNNMNDLSLVTYG
jgi:hypothetical protein